MATPKQAATPARSRRMPCAVYFAQDTVAREALRRCTRIRFISFDPVEAVRLAGETVFVLADQTIFAEHLKRLRAPNVRVIALSEQRFLDTRLDGSVYAYLPPTVAAPLLERMFDNAVDHMHLVQTRREANDKLALANSEISELNLIGAALSGVHETDELLELILTKCREITRADAGSLYLVEELRPAATNGRSHKVLRCTLAQNDSVRVAVREATLPISESSIAGYVAQHGRMVMIEDAYILESWVPYAVNKQFDHESGYRTKSILAVPMMNAKNEIVGVVQLINAKRNYRARLQLENDFVEQVVPFATRQMEIVSSLASQAAVAYENNHLYENIHRLFEGFVKAAVGAIEQRDPATSGHSFRVANMTVALAEAVNRDEKAFRSVKFSRAEMKEIRYASLLHDFGKVGVREEVLVKARKLYPAQLEIILGRFALARRTAQADSSVRKLQYLQQNGRTDFLQRQEQFDRELEAELAELDRMVDFIRQANEPSVLPEGSFDILNEIAGRQFRGPDGAMQPLLTTAEVRLLSIRQGSLDENERAEVKSHVEHTYNFLKQIPWTREIRNVPEIARGHHEKLNGQGYPAGLHAAEIRLPTRLMTIADVFDALAAADRPYKESVSVGHALQILGQMAGRGEIDRDVYDLFVREKVYECWKVDCYEY